MTHIQIAGIRNTQDAVMSANCGVDIIGLLVGQSHTSDDFISKEVAKNIKDNLPKNVKTTLITHLENANDIIEIANYIDVDYIQLHSFIKESEVEIIKNHLPNIKLLRLIHIDENGEILTDISKIKYADFYFTDSINKKTNQIGGTGLTHNLNADKALIEQLNKPVFIAGGLTPKNVKMAIELCKPFGVDVNSGCRATDGSRDKQKIIDFVNEVKSANI